jgi:hypothetical protein
LTAMEAIYSPPWHSTRMNLGQFGGFRAKAQACRDWHACEMRAAQLLRADPRFGSPCPFGRSGAYVP